LAIAKCLFSLVRKQMIYIKVWLVRAEHMASQEPWVQRLQFGSLINKYKHKLSLSTSKMKKKIINYLVLKQKVMKHKTPLLIHKPNALEATTSILLYNFASNLSLSSSWNTLTWAAISRQSKVISLICPFLRVFCKGEKG
jgi:hypothetical protein